MDTISIFVLVGLASIYILVIAHILVNHYVTSSIKKKLTTMLGKLNNIESKLSIDNIIDNDIYNQPPLF